MNIYLIICYKLSIVRFINVAKKWNDYSKVINLRGHEEW